MAGYNSDKKGTGLNTLDDLTLSQSDLHIVSDVSDSGFAKAITEDDLEIHIANSDTFTDTLIANTNFITDLTNNATFVTNVNNASPVTTKGDLYTRNATVPARLGVGSDGQILSADSGEVTGLKWIDAPSGGGSGGGGSKIATGTTPVTVGNTTTEIALFTTSIVGNTLGTSNGVKFRVNLSDFDWGGTLGTLTLRMKYGSTTVVSLVIPATNTAYTNAEGWIEGYLLADASSSAQKGSMNLVVSSKDNEATTTATVIISKTMGTAHGTATESSSGALNLIVTAQWGAANTACTLTEDSYVVEAIISPSGTYSSGVATFTVSGSSQTQNIAHGLGIIPKHIKISFIGNFTGSQSNQHSSLGTYDGTSQQCIYFQNNSSGSGYHQALKDTSNIVYSANANTTVSSAIATMDETNIILSWSNSNGGQDGQLLWEAWL